jgi:S-adenosylmethionine synthetase
MRGMLPPSSFTLRAAEWVLPGHPDKLVDAVADALVHAAEQHRPHTRRPSSPSYIAGLPAM